MKKKVNNFFSNNSIPKKKNEMMSIILRAVRKLNPNFYPCALRKNKYMKNSLNCLFGRKHIYNSVHLGSLHVNAGKLYIY